MRTFGKKGLASAIDVLESELFSDELGRKLKPQMARVYWDAVVGPAVAAATQVVSVRNGDILVVRAKNNVWANELTLLKRDILKRLNQAVGGSVLTDIRFDIGPLDPVPDPDVERHPVPSAEELSSFDISTESGKRIVQASSTIADTELRAVVQRSMMRASQADAWKRANGWLPCTVCGTLAEPAAGNAEHRCPICRIAPAQR